MEENQVFSYNVLTCKIQIGDFDLNADRYINTKYIFTELVNVKIRDSYETLTNTADITLPRDILLSLGEKSDDGFRENSVLYDASSIIQKGQRISIFLGYDDNDKLMFDGFVTSIEAKSPFVLHCEDFGYNLKKTSIPRLVTSKSGTYINDILPDILEPTGVTLHPSTVDMNIKIGQVNIEKAKSLSEILEQWKRNYGLMSFIKFHNSKPCLALSRTYFSTNEDKTLIDGDSSIPSLIDFQDNVANDKLKFSYLDYDTLALEATTLYPENNSRLRLTLITNKSYAKEKAKWDNLSDSEKAGTPPPDEYEIVNESTISKKEAKKNFKAAMSIKDNIANVKNIQDRFNLAEYNVRTYHEFNVDRDTLIANAKAKFTEISQTGIDGTVTIFGDYGLRSSSMVRLYDRRSPEKNGVYISSEVITTFGTKGYRQELKIPHKRGD